MDIVDASQSAKNRPNSPVTDNAVTVNVRSVIVCAADGEMTALAIIAAVSTAAAVDTVDATTAPHISQTNKASCSQARAPYVHASQSFFRIGGVLILSVTLDCREFWFTETTVDFRDTCNLRGFYARLITP